MLPYRAPDSGEPERRRTNAMARKDAIKLSAVIEDMEIRGVSFHFPAGPVDGFQWRYQVTMGLNIPTRWRQRGGFNW
jgi:hypothetical protein